MTENNMSRRKFVSNSDAMALGMSAISPLSASSNFQAKPSKIKIFKVDSNFEREPLISPYRFKVGRISKVWQTVRYLETDDALVGIC